MKKTIKAIYINVSNEDGARVIDLCPSLAEYYRLIDCDCIDIAYRKIGGEHYDIICDDEGLLKASPKVSAIDSNFHPALVGNLIVCKPDGYGDETSLTDDDVTNILAHVLRVNTLAHPRGYKMLVGVDY